MNSRLLAAAVALLSFTACGTPDKQTNTNPTPTDQPKIATRYRAIAGVSMGAIGSSQIAMRHPDMFDAVAPLGGPIDVPYLLRYIERYHLGGFCTLKELEDLVAQNPGHPEVLNSPTALTCMKKTQAELQYEHTQNFVNWRYTSSGGTFDRGSYVDIFTDLTIAHGNPLYYNPDSPFAPGTTASEASPRGIDPEKLKHPPADICTNPLRIKKLFNAEYNPDGKYDAITFCDGEEDPIYYCVKTHKPVDFCSQGPNVVARSKEKDFATTYCGTDLLDTADKSSHAPDIYQSEKGRYDPCREHTRLLPVALAVDINGNGRRDYGEPIINNGHERFDDFGTDGCPSRLEDGKGGCVDDASKSPFAQGNKDPNGDDYSDFDNPGGTENNWLHEAGEAFRDDGLDGVPNTGDFGEKNGTYDVTPNRLRMMEHDPRSNYLKFDEATRKGLDVYLDGGIRDIFNFGVQAKQVFGAVRKQNGIADTLFIRHFSELPGPTPWDEPSFDGRIVKWKGLPRNVFMMYGEDMPSAEDAANGDGDHVGTAFQAAQRFFTMASWMSERWTYKDAPVPKQTSEFEKRAATAFYKSEALGAMRDFGIVVPPGYDDPENKDRRYPVMYMLHGYGMKAAGSGGFLDSAIALFDAPMASPDIKMRKMIIVFVSGRCCYRNKQTNERVCTEEDPQNVSHEYDSDPALERECDSGTFYVDSVGYTGKDGIPYEKSFLELVKYVDDHYRTMTPAEVPVR